MAEILLNPGEEFEHYHSGESRTKVVRGRVLVSYHDKKLELGPGEEIVVPPNTSHVLHNVGDAQACVNCSAHERPPQS